MSAVVRALTEEPSSAELESIGVAARWRVVAETATNRRLLVAGASWVVDGRFECVDLVIGRDVDELVTDGLLDEVFWVAGRTDLFAFPRGMTNSRQRPIRRCGKYHYCG